ncbi:LamG-like jellyroll fold domain-containing protein [Streptomyces sp. NPDC001373]|uniref:LamG-like jellyroll fold domain-containing protein n=1 Tax=Streptomyces sp. NPDC001373 TaxID=3364565 RepID=UPI0036B55056
MVLRQPISAGDAGAVHKLTGGGSSGDASRSDYVLDSGGAKVPLVRDTLLCDRCVLVDGRLKPVLEARFERSRHSTRPESAKGSLGTEDMEGRPFHGPTQELSFVRNLTPGRFSAVLVPTGVANVQRWQLFACNDTTGRVDGFSVEQGAQGLFNTQGIRFHTSPDPAFQDAVFERSSGTCPFTGRDLVPVASGGGHGETALRLTHEGAPAALVVADTLAVAVYAHVSATFDGTTAKLYVNGRAAGSGRCRSRRAPGVPSCWAGRTRAARCATSPTTWTSCEEGTGCARRPSWPRTWATG